MTDETKTCPNCGMENDIGRARCVQCSNPLTAYAGRSTDEESQGRLVEKLAQLDIRPPVVPFVAGFHLFFALFWPLASLLFSFRTRVKVNEEATNYLAASFGSLGIIFSFVTLLPLTIGLCAVAWGVWTQKDWAWLGSLASLGTFGFWAVLHLGATPLLSIIWLAVVIAGVVALMKPDVKAWFGV